MFAGFCCGQVTTDRAVRRSDEPRGVQIAILVVAVFSVLVHSVSVTATGAAPPSGAPLSTILQADGSLNLHSGFTGTIDPSGYRMVTGPEGTPRFVASAIGPESDSNSVYWDDQFGLPGTSGGVAAVACDGAGNLYVGGSFTAVGRVYANSIAKWNGTSWFPLGSGMSGAGNATKVCAMAIIEGTLYAGGCFSKAGDTAASNIAKWDGTGWSALGSGTNYEVFALAASGSDLYVGGQFTSAGSMGANRVAKWNGKSWSPLGTGITGIVHAIAVSGNNVWVGGEFNAAGSVSTAGIAKWDGFSWSALGGGLAALGLYPPSIHALATKDGVLYAGGFFSVSDGMTPAGVAAWDGSSWSTVGDGIAFQVETLAFHGSDLCAAGRSYSASRPPVGRVMQWDGTSWTAIADNMSATDPYQSSVQALTACGGRLFAGGAFSNASGANAENIAAWDGASWSALGAGLSTAVNAMVTSGPDLYVGAHFTDVPGGNHHGVIKWDGSSWTALGDGMDDRIQALAVLGKDLYAGGRFTSAGGVSANCIAKWDGTAWSPLGSGTDNSVYSLAVSAGSLYVGGSFGTAGGLRVQDIAVWSGSSWSALPGGLNGTVRALAPADDCLYIGGDFDLAGGILVNHITKWNGASWEPLGDGADYHVHTLAVCGKSVYAGGEFATAGGVPANYVARWDGASWSPLGDGTDDSVYALAANGEDVYAGGYFGTAGGATANGLARWNGAGWTALGGGVNDLVTALAIQGNTLFAGGEFTSAGGKVSVHFAVWQPRVNVTTVTLTTSPGTMTIGDDPFGFYKPALILTTGTTVSHPGGMPTTVTLDRAAEIRFGGKRVNGAFTLEPVGLQFGGDGASLVVEFSEDDAALLGRPYTEFRAVSFAHPSCYPASMEAVSVTPLPGQSAPFLARIENGRQIYAIVATVPEVGGAYGAVPAALQTRMDDTFATSTLAWAPFRGTTPGLHEPIHDTADSALKVSIHPDATRFRINGWFTREEGYLPCAAVGKDNFVRGRYFVHTGGQANPASLDTIPAVRMRLSNRFAVTSMLEVFNHLNADPEITSCAQELRPSADPARPSVYTVDFDPADGPFMVDNGTTEGVMRAFEAYSTDPQDNGFIALKECAVGVYPAAVLDACTAPVKVYAPTASDAGNMALGLPESALVIANYLYPPAEGEIVAANDPTDSLPTHQQGSFGVTLDTTAVPSDRIGTIVREFAPGADVTAPDYVRVEEGKLYRVRWHLTSTQQSNLNAQIRMRARSVKFMFTHKLEVGGAWATGPGTVTSNNAIAQQTLPGIGTQTPPRDAGGTGGWYTQLVNTPLDTAIRPEFDGVPLPQRMPNLAAEPGPQQPGRSFPFFFSRIFIRDLRIEVALLGAREVPSHPVELPLPPRAHSQARSRPRRARTRARSCRCGRTGLPWYPE